MARQQVLSEGRVRHMSWLTEHQRLIGRCAWVAAWVGLVVGQLHALSRFATTEGAEDLARRLPRRRGSCLPRRLCRRCWDGVMLILFMSPTARSGSLDFLAFTLCAFVILTRRTHWAVGNLGLAGGADRVHACLRWRLFGLLDTMDRQLQRAVPSGLDRDCARTYLDHGGVHGARHHPPSTRFGAPPASPPAGSDDPLAWLILQATSPGQCGAPGDLRLRDPRASAGFRFCGGDPPGRRCPSTLVGC